MILEGPLANAGSPGNLFVDVLPRLVGLLAVVAIGGVVIYLLRRWLRRGPSAPAEGFTLQQLRELHATGSLTNDEFEQAKAAVIGRVAKEATTGDKDDFEDTSPSDTHRSDANEAKP